MNSDVPLRSLANGKPMLTGKGILLGLALFAVGTIVYVSDDPGTLRTSHRYDSADGVDRDEPLLLAVVCSGVDYWLRNCQILAV
jgi:hypothetical protein